MKNKIQSRGSYKEWRDLYEFIKSAPAHEILCKVYKILDRKHCFKSETNSCYVAESITQIFKDTGTCAKKCCGKLKCVTDAPSDYCKGVL